jgi:hypothetical protein
MALSFLEEYELTTSAEFITNSIGEEKRAGILSIVKIELAVASNCQLMWWGGQPVRRLRRSGKESIVHPGWVIPERRLVSPV